MNKKTFVVSLFSYLSTSFEAIKNLKKIFINV